MILNAPEVKQIALAAFPDYSGRSFKVEPFTGPMRLDSYWDGGSHDYYAIINLETLKSEPIPENGTPFSNGGKIAQVTELPLNAAIVRHSIARGKDMGITITLHPNNIRQDMLPTPVQLQWAEQVVLAATRGLKSSYAGIKNYRFVEASKDTGITEQEWNAAKDGLIVRGLLNKAGAITDEGRNAIGNANLWNLKRQTVCS